MADWANFAVHCTDPEETLYVFAHWGGAYMLDALDHAIEDLKKNPVGFSGRHLAARLLIALTDTEASHHRGLGGFSVSGHLIANENPIIHIYELGPVARVGGFEQTFAAFADDAGQAFAAAYRDAPPEHFP